MATWAALFVNPLFLAGGALVAVPILIHLINRRRFREVEWAAMEFLLAADKKNRRRVRLESLILLLLRCLAMLLIAALLARPRAWSEAGLPLLAGGEVERVVLLDDSASLRVRLGNGTLFDAAKAQLVRLIDDLAREPRSNRLTVLLTSAPDRPVIRSEIVRVETVDDLLDRIGGLVPGEGAADIAGALIELERALRAETTQPTRVIYVVSDLRETDWDVAAAAEIRADDPHPLATLRRLDDLATATFLVDVSETGQADGELGQSATAETRTRPGNVAVVEVRPDGPILAGVASAFDVTVENFGTTEVRDALVELTVGETIPLRREVARLAPGRRTVVRFEPTFGRGADEASSAGPRAATTIRDESLTAEVFVPNELANRLPDDDRRVYAATVMAGVPVLLVDGDPSARYGESETFYLRRALMPPGPVSSGLVADTVTEAEFETAELSRYEVIFLCDVGAVSQNRLAELAAWVAAGGGLVIAPGGRTEARTFTERLGPEGRDLAVALTARDGDETGETWSQFELLDQSHPALRIFTGDNNLFLRNVKVFRWWRLATDAAAGSTEPVASGPAPADGSTNDSSSAPDAPSSGTETIAAASKPGVPATVRARLSGPSGSPAMIERTFGRGRVFQFAFPLDAEWTNWPTDPSYLVVMQELARYLARGGTARASLDVGATVRVPLPLTEYRPEATLTRPDGTTTAVAARPVTQPPAAGSLSGDSASAGDTPPGAGVNGPDSNIPDTRVPGSNRSIPPDADAWELVLDGLDRRGFYTLTLTTIDNQPQTRRLAVNIPARESNLVAADPAAIDRALADSRASRIGLAAWTDASVRADTSEWWKETLLILVGILGVEQSLAWWFGRRRRMT